MWVPDPQIRDDREVVRLRLECAEKITVLKTQIRSLLKRWQITVAEGKREGWTVAFRTKLRALADGQGKKPLAWGTRTALASLLRQLEWLEEERERLDEAVTVLASKSRYRHQATRLQALCGVGQLTAMVFLTELGDLARFANRRQVAAYLGLAPSSYESGEGSDRKGRITRHGSGRVRKVLCQAVWTRVRCEAAEQSAYQRIVRRNPKKKKIAVVACMRRLAIRMWHQALHEQDIAPRPKAGGAAPRAPRDLSPSGPKLEKKRREANSRPASPPASGPARALGSRPRGALSSGTGKPQRT